MAKRTTKQPARTAIGVSPVSGKAPPVEHRFKPGNKVQGNRDTAGAIIKNYINSFARRHLRKSTLERYRDADSAPHLKRVAANRVLLAMDEGQDFDRIIEHTDGRPRPATDVTVNVILRTPDDRAAEASAVADRLRAILKPAQN